MFRCDAIVLDSKHTVAGFFENNVVIRLFGGMAWGTKIHVVAAVTQTKQTGFWVVDAKLGGA